jgi:hypothetical protein
VDQAVRDPIHGIHAARRRTVMREPEDAEDAVYVHEQDRKL